MRPAGGELIDPDDLLIRPVHDWNDRERVRIEISICVLLARICSEDEALEEAPVFVRGIETTVWPRLEPCCQPAAGYMRLDGTLLTSMMTSNPGGSLNSLIFFWNIGEASQTSTKVWNSGLECQC